MNRDTAAGNWAQLKGKIKQKWGKLTDDDLTRAEGDKEYLMGKLHEQYGLAKDRAKDELDHLGYKASDVSGRAGRMDLGGADTTETGGRVNEGNASKRNAGSESVDEDIRAAGYSGQEQTKEMKAGFADAEGGSSPRNKLEASSKDRESEGIDGSSKDEPGRH